MTSVTDLTLFVGHKTYIGFLYLEHTLNNPVLNVFASVLLEAVEKKKEHMESPAAETVTHKNEVEEEEVGPNEQSALELMGTTEGGNGSNQLESEYVLVVVVHMHLQANSYQKAYTQHAHVHVHTHTHTHVHIHTHTVFSASHKRFFQHLTRVYWLP